MTELHNKPVYIYIYKGREVKLLMSDVLDCSVCWSSFLSPAFVSLLWTHSVITVFNLSRGRLTVTAVFFI